MVGDEDIQEIHDLVVLSDTPIIVSERVEFVPVEHQRSVRRRVEAFLDEWKRVWEAKALDQYIAFYAAGFRHQRMSRRAWREYKRGVFESCGRIRVEFALRQILRHDEYLVVTFDQSYVSDVYQDSGVKRLFLIEEDGQWRILGEEFRENS